MNNAIDFFLDLASPYSYLAIEALPAVAHRHGYDIQCHPVSLASLKQKIGNQGADTRAIPAKHRYVLADCRRWACRLGIAFCDAGAVDTDLLHRGTFFAADRGQALPYLTLLARALWTKGSAESGEALLAAVAPSLGWPAAELVAYAASQASAQRLARTLEHAVSADVFGVPTTVAGGGLWWGNDRLPMLDAHLARTFQRTRLPLTSGDPAGIRSPLHTHNPRDKDFS